MGGVGSCLTRHRRTVGEIWAPPKRAFLARRGDDDAPEPLQELGRFDIMREVVVRDVSVVRGVRGPRAGAGRNRHCRASLAHLASPSVQGRIAARRCVSILEFTTQRECGPTPRTDYSAKRYSRRLCARGNRAPSSIARSGTPAQGVRTESPCTAFSTAPLSSLNALSRESDQSGLEARSHSTSTVFILNPPRRTHETRASVRRDPARTRQVRAHAPHAATPSRIDV